MPTGNKWCVVRLAVKSKASLKWSGSKSARPTEQKLWTQPWRNSFINVYPKWAICYTGHSQNVASHSIPQCLVPLVSAVHFCCFEHFSLHHALENIRKPMSCDFISLLSMWNWCVSLVQEKGCPFANASACQSHLHRCTTMTSMHSDHFRIGRNL